MREIEPSISEERLRDDEVEAQPMTATCAVHNDVLGTCADLTDTEVLVARLRALVHTDSAVG